MLFYFWWFTVWRRSSIRFQTAGQRVIGEPVAAGLALDDSGIWDPDFVTAAKQEPELLSYYFVLFFSLF